MKKERYDRVSKEWFEKGKLEQKKEELEFLIKLDKGLTDMGTIIPHIKERIKQLQKEIGGMKTSEEKQDEKA